MDKYDQLEKIKKLLDEGAITQEEYDQEKEKLLNRTESSSSEFWGMQEDEYCMFMHLSQFLGMVVPFAGYIMPVVMWANAKDYSRGVDAEGRIIFNWLLSMVIYFTVSVVLVFAIIGIPMMIALFVVNIVFVILGAIKARNGIEWEYPLSIPFFRRTDSDLDN